MLLQMNTKLAFELPPTRLRFLRIRYKFAPVPVPDFSRHAYLNATTRAASLRSDPALR